MATSPLSSVGEVSKVSEVERMLGGKGLVSSGAEASTEDSGGAQHGPAASDRIGTKGLGAVIGLAAAALLIAEVGLTRLFSATLWYHFAFLAVSLVMFGLTAGALAVYLYPAFFGGSVGVFDPALTRRRMGQSRLVFAIGFQAAVLLHLHLPIDTRGGVGGLMAAIITGLSLLVPFSAAGAAIALLLSRWPHATARLYAADLVGAGLGAMGCIVLLTVLHTPTALLWAGALAAWAAAKAHGDLRRWAPFSLVAALVLPFTGLTTLEWGKSEVGPEHGYTTRGKYEFEGWNSFSRITVEDKAGFPIGWGLSPTFQPRPGEIFQQKFLKIDGAAATVLVGFAHQDWDAARFLKYDITSLAHALRPQGRVAVIGVGGGRDILTALQFAPREVHGIEINPLILYLLHGPYADFTGRLFERPNVRLHNAEGRGFLTRWQGEPLDVVQASLIDSWAATANGAFALTENGLYTREALTAYFNALAPHGIVNLSRWYVPPLPGELYRTVRLMAEGLADRGILDPRPHMLIAAYQAPDLPAGTATLLASAQPFSDQDRELFLARSASMGFRVVFAPEPWAPPSLADDSPAARIDREVARLLNPAEAAQAMAESPLDLSAPTDDRPFFFHMLKGSSLFTPLPSQVVTDFNLAASRMLLGMLAFLVILAVSLLAIPLTVREGVGGAWRLLTGSPAEVIFFAAIGLAFMLVELGLAQRLGLYLGSPTLGLAVVLGGILVAAGTGSHFSDAWGFTAPSRTVSMLGFGAGFMTVAAVVTWGGDAWIQSTMHWGDAARAGVALALVVAAGVPMGMLFPMGMAAVQATRPELGPWMWAVNGAASVLASAVSLAVSLFAGIGAAMTLGLALYVVALFTLARMRAKAT